MSDPDFVTQAIADMFEDRDPSVTSIFVAATPIPAILWVSLQGYYKKSYEHHSSQRREDYSVSIPVARLKGEVKHYSSRATVTLGIFRLIDEMGTWKTWGTKDVRVQENPQTRQVTVELNLVLDSESVGVESFSYTVDLYLSAHGLGD